MSCAMMQYHIMWYDQLKRAFGPNSFHLRDQQPHFKVEMSWKWLYCTFAARRLTASSLRRCISGVPGQLLVLSVLAALEGGVGCGGWVSRSSVLDPSPPWRVGLLNEFCIHHGQYIPVITSTQNLASLSRKENLFRDYQVNMENAKIDYFSERHWDCWRRSDAYDLRGSSAPQAWR